MKKSWLDRPQPISDPLIIMLRDHINVTKIADDSENLSYPQMRDSRSMISLGSQKSNV
jgi:hypothetical protein